MSRIDHDRADPSIRPAERDRLELRENSLLDEVLIVGDGELQPVRAYRNRIALRAGRQDEADLDAVGRLLDRAAHDGAAREDARGGERGPPAGGPEPLPS